MKVRRARFGMVWSVLCLFCWAATLSAAPWLPFGPDGGDARRFAQDPQDPAHLYLGTATGWLYESRNGGANWHRVSRVGKRDDLVLDGIVVDPTDAKHIVVGGFVVGANDGGLFITHDGGNTWMSQAEMRGQSIRALTSAPSDPKILVAGTLRGIFRSIDGGQRWVAISPADSTEIHDIQSVAIDPVDPSIIYAGTWHLPWKTIDGGENWVNIKQGIIEDSDVFSIIVDPSTPSIVYASACSGIYKSEDAGEQFSKVQGIPSSARRTRVLHQDPEHLDVVFAGTTEGLFRSEDAGKMWSRTTDADVIVNDVFVDRSNPQHVLLATDRAGILASDDGGDSFHASNDGFSARQITALKRDVRQPATVFVGVVNDKTWGGVFQSDNGGLNWNQRSSGLEGRDVFSLGQAPDGTMIAGTSHGLFRLNAQAEMWDRVENAPGGSSDESEHLLPPLARPPVPVRRNQFAARTGLKLASVRSPKAMLHTTLRNKKAGKPGQSRAKASPHAVEKRSAAQRATGKAGTRTVARSKAPVRPGGAARTGSAARTKVAAGTRAPLRPTVQGRSGRSARAAAPAASASTLLAASASTVAGSASRAAASASTTPLPIPQLRGFDGGVFSLATSENVVLAATPQGLLMSSDNGESWTGGGPDGSVDWRYLAAARRNVVGASLRAMQFSNDSGATWVAVKLPEGLTQISAVAVEASGEMWVGGREGVYVSADAGASWSTPKNLYVSSVTSIYYDEPSNRILVTAEGAANIAFEVQLPQKTVTFADTGWDLRFVRPVGDHLVGATFFDGIVIQPKMIASPVRAQETASR